MKCKECNGTGIERIKIPLWDGPAIPVFCNMGEWDKIHPDKSTGNDAAYEAGQEFAKMMLNHAHGRFTEGMRDELKKERR